MKKKSAVWIAVILGAILGVAPWAKGLPTIDTREQWEVEGDTHGWMVWDEADDPFGNAEVLQVTPGGNPNGWLETHVGIVESVPQKFRVFTDGSTPESAGYAGNQDYSWSALRANFDFKYDVVPPAGLGSLQFYFYSGTSGREWKKYIDPADYPTSAGVWKSYSIGFAWDPSRWSLMLGGGTEAQFNADAQDVDRIGFYLVMNAYNAEQYVGFDNFYISVPEPSTVFFLSAVLLSMGVSFRSRIAEVVAKLRGMIGKA